MATKDFELTLSDMIAKTQWDADDRETLAAAVLWLVKEAKARQKPTPQQIQKVFTQPKTPGAPHP